MARMLTRDPGRALLGGVAAGFGRYLDVDPVLVRLAFVVLTLANGIGLLAYLVSWAMIPREGAVATGVDAAFSGAREAAETLGRVTDDAGGGRLIIGYGLVGLGLLLLFHNLDWFEWPHWARFRVLWPLVLVGMGAGLVQRAFRKREAA
jgi:phage shock protein PspC (stress-responsive transcriptional regulator)